MQCCFWIKNLVCLFLLLFPAVAFSQQNLLPISALERFMPVEDYFSQKDRTNQLSATFFVPKKPAQAAEALPQSSLFLPKWCAADLPFFCKIEHQIGLQLPVAVKFRLGSVEYVDWLEGK